MTVAKSQIYTHVVLIITLILCCLTNSVCAGKLSKTSAMANRTEVGTSTKMEVEEITASTDINSFQEEDAEDDYDAVVNENESAEKNAVQPTAANKSPSIWSIINRLWNWIREDASESLFADDGKTSAVGEGRTFGKIRRMQMALIPIVFKFGVLSAMVAFLVAVGVKTLFLVKVLIVMNLLALLAKFFTLKSHLGHVEHFSAPPPAPIWNPYVTSGWHSTPEDHHINKEIHLHIHGGHLQSPGYSYGNVASGKSQGWERRNDPYGAYETIALQGQQRELMPNELTTAINTGMPSGKKYSNNFPGNHRMF